MNDLGNQTRLMGRPLPGFEKINRYWDKTRDLPAAKILPGEYYVTKSDEAILTVLGSCISACIRDRLTKVGGMNHFMLPLHPGDRYDKTVVSEATRYGTFAMEHLINDILKHGGHRERLEVKIFGGGKIMENMTDVGLKNIAFVRNFLKSEGYRILSEDLGDIYPRKVLFVPHTGKAYVKRLKHLHNETIIEREQSYKSKLNHEKIQGDVELF